METLSASQFVAFLAGIFDAEGTIYFHRKDAQGDSEVYLTNKDNELLRRIQKTLKQLGLFSKLEQRVQDPERMENGKSGTISRLVIWRQDDVQRLLKSLELGHDEKKRKKMLALEFAGAVDASRRNTILDSWEALLGKISSDRDKFAKAAFTGLRTKQHA